MVVGGGWIEQGRVESANAKRYRPESRTQYLLPIIPTQQPRSAVQLSFECNSLNTISVESFIPGTWPARNRGFRAESLDGASIARCLLISPKSLHKPVEPPSRLFQTLVFHIGRYGRSFCSWSALPSACSALPPPILPHPPCTCHTFLGSECNCPLRLPITGSLTSISDD